MSWLSEHPLKMKQEMLKFTVLIWHKSMINNNTETYTRNRIRQNLVSQTKKMTLVTFEKSTILPLMCAHSLMHDSTDQSHFHTEVSQ